MVGAQRAAKERASGGRAARSAAQSRRAPYFFL